MNELNLHGEAILHIAHAATRARRQDLLAALAQHHAWTVQSGPFKGTRLPERSARDDDDMLPKLLGCYEAELHPVLDEIVTASPDLIISVGSAGGYYAAGMARRLPAAFIHAFDQDPKSQEACRHAVTMNDVGKRVSVSGQCTQDLLQAIVPRGRTPVVICDAEGQERELVDPWRIPALKTATLVVECHDFIEASITQTLVDRLTPTHTLTGICEGGRDPNLSPFLQGLNSLDRWLAVCEYRPTLMHWLVAKPKSATAS